LDGKNPDVEPEGAAPPQRAGQSRSINLAAVAGAVLIIALIAFALYRRSGTMEPAPVPRAEAPQASPAAPAGTTIAKEVPVALTPEASIIAERYRCVCGCQDALNVCTCSQSPGSNEMKLFLLKLVLAKSTSAEIDKAMIEKWGHQVLMNTALPMSNKRPASPSKVRSALR
jgi:cytochrome c-type biogenesis protein CcmH/NrfF